LILAEISTGLATGLASTAAMSLTEYPIWQKWGIEAVSEWHLNQVMMARMLHRPPQNLVLQGLFLHFVHGGLAGVAFALVLPLLPFRVPIAVTGVAFGLILWVIALLMMKPVTGVGMRDHSLKLLPLIVSLGGHLLYGLLLGLGVSLV
jgi:hypothetical protein